MADRAATAPGDTEPALNVAMVYQDPLTRQWAADLWDRVGQVIDSGGVRCQAWRTSELAQAVVFARAVRAAAEADVVVISIRDGGELPLFLNLWVDAWLPKRDRRPGALVALIGVPAQPDAQMGQAHPYLEAVARRGGMDFLPRETRLPEGFGAFSAPRGIAPAAQVAAPRSGGTPAAAATAYLNRE